MQSRSGKRHHCVGRNSLIIWGQSGGVGKLTATGGSDSSNNWLAGIGSNSQDGKCGVITINGGTIVATGEGGWSAGIGGEEAKITINSGNVTATGGNQSAGIGGVSGTPSSFAPVTITINGGTVNAQGGGWTAAGIGAGASGHGADIIITGGNVTAVGNEYGAGIGGGSDGTATSTIKISGGFVTASSSDGYPTISGNFSTGSGGNAVIVCDRGIQDTSSGDNWSGIFVNSTTKEMSVYGKQTLTPDIAQQFSSVTLSIEENATLTVDSSVGVTLTGESSISENGELINQGNITNVGTVTNRGTINNTNTIENNGKINNYGTINGNGTINGHPPCTSCKLTAKDLDFSAVEGYTPLEQLISIHNEGTDDATIEKVEVKLIDSSDPSDKFFEIITGIETVGANRTDTSWMIKPVAGLPAGSYSGTITITYNGIEKTSAEVKVTFTVSQKEIPTPPSTPVDTPATDTGGGSPAPSTTVNSPATDPASGKTTVAVNTRFTTSGTTAKASVSDSDMNRAVDSAVTEAARRGTAPVVEVTVRTSSRADSLNVTLPTAALEKLAEAEDSSLVIVSDIADIALDNTALSALAAQATGNTVILEVKPVAPSELSEAQADAVGEAPVEELTIISNGEVIHDYHGGRITVTLPYKLAKGQSASDVVVYYLDDAGTLTPCATSYDIEAEEVTFVTVHLSKYVIGDTALGEEKDCPSEKFTDLDIDAWYHDYTDYVIAHGLMQGTGGGLFAPDGTVSRAQMVMVLWNMSGKPVVNYYMTYSDVSEDAWCAEAIRWATSEGIAAGYGGGLFGPGDPITREQMAVMLYRYEQKYGEGGFTGDWMYRLPFADLDQISDWAFEAVAWCNMEGVMSGKADDIFDPKGPAKRSEMAAILTRYCEVSTTVEAIEDTKE